jgi:hypothetical protein
MWNILKAAAAMIWHFGMNILQRALNGWHKIILNPYRKFANSLYYKELHENPVHPMGETAFFMFII